MAVTMDNKRRYEMIRSRYDGLKELEEIVYKNRSYQSLRKIQITKYRGGAYSDRQGQVWYTEIREVEEQMDIENEQEKETDEQNCSS